MDNEYTVEEFQSAIEDALAADGIRTRVEVREEEPIGVMIEAWQSGTGDEQSVFTAGPVDLTAQEARSQIDGIREHFAGGK